MKIYSPTSQAKISSRQLAGKRSIPKNTNLNSQKISSGSFPSNILSFILVGLALFCGYLIWPNLSDITSPQAVASSKNNDEVRIFNNFDKASPSGALKGANLQEIPIAIEYYTVIEGDNVKKISQKLAIDEKYIKSLNNLDEQSILKIGQIIKLR